MKFEFRAPEADGLRIMEQIPDYRICQIQGRNGIGKTLAARMLELISGQQPFAALPHAWDSLVDLLGPIEIVVSNLPGDRTLTYALNSNDWRNARTPTSAAADLAGHLTLNGETVSWPEARKILQVRRIAGDEGLPETLGRTLRERALEADSGQAFLGPVIDAWSRELDAVDTLTENVSPERVTRLREAISAAQQATSELAEKRRHHLIATQVAISTRDRLSRMIQRASSLPRAITDYESARTSYEEASASVASLERKLGTDSLRKIQNNALRADLAHWESLRARRQRAYTQARVDEQQVLRALGLAQRPDRATRQRLKSGWEEDARAAQERAQFADIAGEVRKLTGDLQQPLKHRAAVVLAQPVLADPVRVTGDQLLRGLQQQEVSLRNVPRPGEAAAALAEGASLERRLRLLATLPEYMRTTDRKQDNVEAAIAELARLRTEEAEAGSETDTHAELSKRRDDLAGATIAAASSLATIRELLNDEAAATGTPLEREERSAASDASDADEDSNDDASDLADLPALIGLDELLNQIQTKIHDDVLFLERHAKFTGSFSPPPNGRDIGAWLPNLHHALELVKVSIAEGARTSRSFDDQVVAWEQRAATLREEELALRLRMKTAIEALLDPKGRFAAWRPGVEACLRAAGLAATTAEAWAESLSPLSAANGSDDKQASELALARALWDIGLLGSAVEEGAARTREAWGAIAGYLNATSNELSPRFSADISPTTKTISALSGQERVLREWTEAEIGELLSSPELREELFDGAPRVDFDLAGLAVLWESTDGRRRRRPLEAFSSGEQVFAYTRAKLEQLKGLKENSEASVIILDEFGAFVARDRFSQLMAFVEHQALGHVADQVVVLLPLSTDGLATLSGSVKEELSENLTVFDNYFAESAGHR